MPIIWNYQKEISQVVLVIILPHACLKIMNCILFYIAHSPEIRGFCYSFCPAKMLQNLLYFYNKKSCVVFFVFHFEQLSFISETDKVARNEKRKKLHGFSYCKNIANFEAFWRDKNLSKNLLFLGSVIHTYHNYNNIHNHHNWNREHLQCQIYLNHFRRSLVKMKCPNHHYYCCYHFQLTKYRSYLKQIKNNDFQFKFVLIIIINSISPQIQGPNIYLIKGKSPLMEYFLERSAPLRLC